MKSITTCTPASVKPVVDRTVKVRSVRGLADNGEDMPAPRGGGVRASSSNDDSRHQQPTVGATGHEIDQEEGYIIPPFVAETETTAALFKNIGKAKAKERKFTFVALLNGIAIFALIGTVLSFGGVRSSNGRRSLFNLNLRNKDDELVDPQPTPIPTQSPAAAPATGCETEQDQYVTCLVTNIASQDDAFACIGCVNDASSNAPLDSCNAFEDSFCNSLSQCTTCGICGQVATSYIDCLVSDSQCQFDCEGDTGPPPCTLEESAYQSCISNLGFLGSACIDCYNAALPVDATTCELFQSQFCSAFNLCDCGSCDDEMIDWLDCRLDSCSISC